MRITSVGWLTFQLVGALRGRAVAGPAPGLPGGAVPAAVLSRLGVLVSRSTVLRVLMTAPVPAGPVPTVLSVDDFALHRGRRYATLLIDAVTHRRAATAASPWSRYRTG